MACLISVSQSHLQPVQMFCRNCFEINVHQPTTISFTSAFLRSARTNSWLHDLRRIFAWEIFGCRIQGNVILSCLLSSVQNKIVSNIWVRSCANLILVHNLIKKSGMCNSVIPNWSLCTCWKIWRQKAKFKYTDSAPWEKIPEISYLHIISPFSFHQKVKPSLKRLG